MAQTVSFTSQGIKISANVYLPKDTSSKKRAAIVVSHPMGGVKEQTAGLYAEKLSKLGYIALTFDAAYQGESGGVPRFLEDPFQRVEDVKNAVTYLSTLPEVDSERIGALGICASGGYVPHAAQTDVRIKAAAGISGADVGMLYREGISGSTSFDDFQKSLLWSAQARKAEIDGQEPMITNLIPCTAEDAAVLPEKTLFREAYYYYRTPRAQHPRSENKYLVRSIDKLASFAAYDYNHLISPRPLLMIAGSEADTKYFSEVAYEKAKEPKELFIIDGATHVDLYDILKYVDPVVAKLDSFFTQYLVSA
ncbi:dienelactone hydrolase domain-containing protein [Cunninghamella echinulata]|nr:dienelactone hydrolase domain-containing protein [Cunninghamella echinulata]